VRFRKPDTRVVTFRLNAALRRLVRRRTLTAEITASSPRAHTRRATIRLARRR
jgi:hypothetical protein